VASGILCILLALTFADDLGRFRLFWPNDGNVFAGVVLLGIAIFIFFAPAMNAFMTSRRGEENEGRDA
jgi:hypothetical protein